MTIAGEHFLNAAGQPAFLLGVNYEGPADRAWMMWEDGTFDSTLIARDLDRARSLGISMLRVFLQEGLDRDIRAGRWTKLDEFLRLVDQRGLRIILTFGDYPQDEVSRLAEVDALVAARYRERPTIFAYDLKNEPRFGDLALAEYPAGTYVALQDAATVAAIGEWIPRAGIGGYRASDEGRGRVPARLSDDRAYVYANLLAAYLQFLDEASAYAVERGSTSVRFALSADSARWASLTDALNDSLATWIKVRTEAIWAADPDAHVTIGHVDPILASLPANNWLDYRTLHRYPTASSAGIRLAMELFDDVRVAIPGKPLVLGEFGFSNSDVPDDRSAALEEELIREVHERGGAGALKWMLNDFPQGFNTYQNNLGMFRGDGSPKPIVAAFIELAALVPATHPAPPRLPSYDIPNGHFFTQTSGRPPDVDGSGFRVTNDDGIDFWDWWRELGIANVGYPISGRFMSSGGVTQVFQKAVFQWRPGQGFALANLVDDMHDLGLDPLLRSSAFVPLPRSASADVGKEWEQIVSEHLALLEGSPRLRRWYFEAADPILMYGLPTSDVEDFGDALTIRTQRAVLIEWQVDVPWAVAGEVTAANIGDIAKKLDMFPAGALVPQPAPPL